MERGRPKKFTWEKKVQLIVTIDFSIVEELKKLVPKGEISEFVNQLLKENLFNKKEYAFVQKRIAAQKVNYWDYEIKRIETEEELRKAGLKNKGWDF